MRLQMFYNFLLGCVVCSSFTLFSEDRQTYTLVKPNYRKNNVKVFADALYWYTSETVDWAFTLSSTPNTVKASYKTFTFDWKPGFRVGLGYNMNSNLWDTTLSYTWFRSKANDETHGSVTPAFLAARLSLLEPFAFGIASLDINYNMFDFQFGRNICACKGLLLKPTLGVRGGWIDQTINSSWERDIFGTHTATEDLKQHFQCGGPSGGVTLKWCTETTQFHRFSLIGQFTSDFLWGHWSITDQFTDNLFFTEIEVKTLDRNFGCFVLRGFLGAEWSWLNCCHTPFINIRLGYEMENWFNQFQIFSDASGSQNNNLILQGANFCLQVAF